MFGNLAAGADRGRRGPDRHLLGDHRPPGHSLYLQFTEAFEALRPGVAVLLAAVFALLFFGSVLAHETPPTQTSIHAGPASSW